MVDDDVQQLKLWSTILHLYRYHVTTADCSTQALELARLDGIALAVLDYNLPDMNGSNLVVLLRVVCPYLKTILYSGELNIPDRDLNEVDAYIAKAEGPARLLTCIADLLGTEEKAA